VDCHAENCPDSVPTTTVDYGTSGLYFSQAPDKDTPGVTLTWGNDQFKLVYTRIRGSSQTVPFPRFDETVETLTVQLFRGTAP
ncbi:MAG: hypothetical protein KDM81_18230, partial [Verrucomicrobiae bacterium]|nr:hypothetical protein [Verrucomicrobiae bacterium]